MSKINTKIGDVFSVQTGPETKKYFQYISNDQSQLNSDVIRAFMTEYLLDDRPGIKDVIKDNVDFYAHCVIKFGIKLGLWKKVDNNPEVGRKDVWFRDTNDYGVKVGQEPIKISHSWYVWKINEPFQRVGNLKGDYRNAEIGVVISPHQIVERLTTGQYSFVYPGFE